MKNTSRARRRSDLERMKARARKIYPRDRQATWANHLAGCSCLGCGNERHHTGKPGIAEVRQRLIGSDTEALL